jgi:very-short-patch-repair endonuclease
MGRCRRRRQRGRSGSVLPIHGEVPPKAAEGPVINTLAIHSRSKKSRFGAVPADRTLISRRMRQAMGHTEVRLWACLKGRQVDGWTFRRQHPIGPYYVDFYCPAAGLIIEVNGPAHDDDRTWARDQARYARLECQGYRVVCIIVQDIDRDMIQVLDRIHAELLAREELGYSARPPISGPSGASRHLPINGEDY